MPVNTNKLDKDIQALKKNMTEDLQKQQKDKQDQSIAQTLETKKKVRAGRREAAEKEHVKKVDKMLESAEHMKNDSKGYDSFLSGMLSITAHCRLIADANPLGSLIKGVAGLPASALEWGIEKIWEQDVEVSLGSIKDSLGTRADALPEVKLPNLLHYVEFTDNDELNIATIGKNMRRSDGKPFTAVQEQAFADTMNRGMELWLEANGYKRSIANQAKPNGFVSTTDGKALTKAGFEALRDDPQKGLNQFLSGTYGMDIEMADGPRAPRM